MNISFTPNDCIILYEILEEKLGDNIEYLSPDNYFKEDKLLTLDDTKEYEIYLKLELKKLNNKYPKEIIDICNELILNNNNLDNLDYNFDNIILFFRDCKKNN